LSKEQLFIFVAFVSIPFNFFAQNHLDSLEQKLLSNKTQHSKWQAYLDVERESDLPDFNASKMNKVVKTAKSYLGTKHCMGGLSKKCIDCSGLLYMSFKDNGINVPHSAEEISRYGEYILNTEELQKGDLVYFIDTYSTDKFITHAGIFLGENKFIHTSSSKGVMISTLVGSYYWESKYIFAKRLIKKLN
jgi:cell wall-associated NlpC family hydrolase